MNISNGNSFGTSAVSLGTSLRDGGEGCKPAGNSWLFAVGGIQRTGNPI